MSGDDPDDRRSRPADRHERALAGRADPRLPRPRPRARRSAARLCPSDRGARVGRGARRRGGDHGERAEGAAARHSDRAQGHRRHQGHPDDLPVETPADNIPDTDAACAERLAAAGTVLIGKTTTHEFADGGPSFDLPAPPARNPWNTEHFTAGSSSGTGAGVAAGLILGGIGTDTGGSIRGPAALVRHRRDQADLRPRQPRRRRAGRLQPRSYRADGVDRRGLRADAAGPGRPRPARSGERRRVRSPTTPRSSAAASRACKIGVDPSFPRDRLQSQRRAPSAASTRRSPPSAVSAPKSARCSCRHCRIGAPAAR